MADFRSYLEEVWAEIDSNINYAIKLDEVEEKEKKRIMNNTAAIKTRMFFRVRQIGVINSDYFQGFEANLNCVVSAMSHAISSKPAQKFREQLLAKIFRLMDSPV